MLLALGISASAHAVDITNTAYVAYRNEAGINPQVVSSSTTFTVTAPVPPGQPASFAASPEGAVIRLAWQPSFGSYAVSGYQVYRATYPGLSAGPGTFLAWAAGGSNSVFDDPAVVARSSYCYVIKAVDATGLESPLSAEACAVAPVIPPAPPASLAAGVSGQAVWLSWSAAAAGTDPVSGYRVYRAVDPAFTPSSANLLAEIGGASSSAYVDSAVAAGVTYHYLVRTVSTDNLESGDSARISAGLPSDEEAKTVRLILSLYDSSGRLVITVLDSMIAAPVGILSVGEGERNLALARGASLSIVLSDGTVVKWDGRDEMGNPVANGIYTVKAVSILPDGRISQATLSFSLTREFEKLIESALLAPNPAKDVAWVGFKLASTLGEVEVKIYTVAGEMVYSAKLPGTAASFKWDLRNAQGSRVGAGLYLVVIEAFDSWSGKHDRRILKLAVEGK